MTISLENTDNNKKSVYVERKFGLTMVSKVNYSQTKKSLHIQYFFDTSVKTGLADILSHFHEQDRWPRTISTKATEGRQVVVDTEEEALAWFKAANYFDCRISAYPP